MPLARHAVLAVSVADTGSRRVLVTYRLPVTFLEPFEQYFVDLYAVCSISSERSQLDSCCAHNVSYYIVLLQPNINGGIHLYVSLMRKLSHVQDMPQKCTALEVLVLTVILTSRFRFLIPIALVFCA